MQRPSDSDLQAQLEYFRKLKVTYSAPAGNQRTEELAYLWEFLTEKTIQVHAKCLDYYYACEIERENSVKARDEAVEAKVRLEDRRLATIEVHNVLVEDFKDVPRVPKQSPSTEVMLHQEARYWDVVNLELLNMELALKLDRDSDILQREREKWDEEKVALTKDAVRKEVEHEHEIDRMQREHSEALNKEASYHNQSMTQIRADLTESFRWMHDGIQRLDLGHARHIKREIEDETTVARLRREHRTTLSEMRERHVREIRRIRDKHNAYLQQQAATRKRHLWVELSTGDYRAKIDQLTENYKARDKQQRADHNATVTELRQQIVQLEQQVWALQGISTEKELL